jgi:hypothetical protein
MSAYLLVFQVLTTWFLTFYFKLVHQTFFDEIDDGWWHGMNWNCAFYVVESLVDGRQALRDTDCYIFLLFFHFKVRNSKNLGEASTLLMLPHRRLEPNSRRKYLNNHNIGPWSPCLAPIYGDIGPALARGKARIHNWALRCNVDIRNVDWKKADFTTIHLFTSFDPPLTAPGGLGAPRRG